MVKMLQIIQIGCFLLIGAEAAAARVKRERDDSSPESREGWSKIAFEEYRICYSFSI